MIRHLLWIDCGAAWLAGTVMLLFSDALERLLGLPVQLLLFAGAMNLLYGTGSCTLALRAQRPLPLIGVLVGANLVCAALCVGLGLHFAGTATHWGLIQLFAEALFVGGLACLEWRYRERLRVRTKAAQWATD